jgi:hypothetical protein
MRKEIQKLHLDTLSIHNDNLFTQLLHVHNISSSMKGVEFEEEENGYRNLTKEQKGVFLTKTVGDLERKYFINEVKLYDKEGKILLPLKIRKTSNLYLKTGTGKYDIILRPIEMETFRLTPTSTIGARRLIDDITAFDHSNKNHQKLHAFFAVSAYAGKTFIAECSPSEFGKSSVFDLIHAVTDKSPVFKPRSIPGVLHMINETGNLVFDEVQGSKKEVRDIIEEIAQYLGGGKTYYQNGSLKGRGLKQRYNCMNQSITFIYNNLSQYSDPKKEFFDFIWANQTAMDSRFLKVKLDGILTEKFDKDFDIPKTAEENKMYYIALAKELLWLQEVYRTNSYKRRWERVDMLVKIKGRKKQVYDAITYLIDMYCENDTEYNLYCGLLEKAILDYDLMVKPYSQKEEVIITEEEVK